MTTALVMGSLIGSTLAFGQASFEVASVKPQLWTGQGSVGVFVRGNTLTAEHVALYDLAEFAFNLRSIQLSGGPAWADRGRALLSDSVLFQVTAKAAADPPLNIDQFRPMLQTLLADRFQLKVHHIQKDLPVYNLVTAKSGSKLKESASDTKFEMNTRAGKLTRITAAHAPLKNLIGQVEGYAGRPVFDKTGLTGTYDFELDFVPDSLSTAGLDAAAPEAAGASLFTALQEQLGLKLEPAVAPFDTVVIDHAEKPTEN
jgi:bla regulator protein blaR1